MNSIRYAAYRTAAKLRFIQKRLGFHQVSLHAVQTVLERRGLAAGVDTVVDCVDLYGILIDVFHVAGSKAGRLTTEQQAELALNLLLNLYDVNRTGCIRLTSIKVGIATLCSARLSEKYRYFFHQMADNTNHLTRKRLGCLLHDLIQIPEAMNESQPFGGLNVSAAIESCFSMVWGSVGATEDVFLSWLLRGPQTLVWLPTMHQLVAAESVKHEAKCNVCKAYPIVGFRYKCLKCFNYDMCQNCFFTGRISKSHKLKHPTQEYCLATTSKEDAKAFMKTVRNNLSRKHRNKQKLRYLPIYGSEGARDGESVGKEDLPPTDLHVMRAVSNQLSSKPERADITDYDYEPTVKGKVADLHIGHTQRREMENVIDHLENENRELMYEIERLHQRRSESGSDAGSDDARPVAGQAGRGLPGSPALSPDQPDARRDVLRAHNQQLEIQLHRLRAILNERDVDPPGRDTRRVPLQAISPNVPRGVAGRRLQFPATGPGTPARPLKPPPPQPPPYSASPARRLPSPGRGHGTSFLPSPSPTPAPLSYDDHVTSLSDTLSRSADGALSRSADGVLSCTRFELPSIGDSQYFPTEEAELAELIERLDHAYPADVSQSLLDRDSTTVLEMGQAANRLGEAFGQHPHHNCADESGHYEEADCSDDEIVDTSVHIVIPQVSVL